MRVKFVSIAESLREIDKLDAIVKNNYFVWPGVVRGCKSRITAHKNKIKLAQSEVTTNEK